MALQIRGSSQILQGTISLDRIKSTSTSSKIIGYDSNGDVAELDAGGARSNMGIATSDNVSFANITGSAISGSSLSTNGLITSSKDSGTGLSVTADSDLNGALDVEGTVNLQSTLTVAGGTELNGGLNSDGNLAVRDSSDVSKFSVLAASGNTNIEGTLDVTGATTLDSTLQAGASTLASANIAGAINHSGSDASSYLSSGNVNITGGLIIKNVPIGDTNNRSTGHFSTLNTSGDVTVGGSLTVSGTLTTVETTNLIVEDPMILLAKDNTSANSGTNLDIGFMGSFVESSTDKSMGFFRDASDGYFKPFVTEQDLSATNTIDVDDASYVKGTIEAEFRGDITFANDVTIGMHADSDLSGSSTWDGNSNLSLDLKIKDDSVQVGNLDFFEHANDLGGASSSSVKVPSQSSVKAYVDAAVSSGGLSSLEAKDIQVVSEVSSGNFQFVKAREIVEYYEITSTDVNNGYFDLTATDGEVASEWEDETSMLFLNGQKMRFSSDTTSNEYYFGNDDSSDRKRVNFTSSDIIAAGDDIEIRYLILS